MTHLDVLEAEAIYILRETAAQARNPVMLYSAGKDSSAVLHLAMKAFFPSRVPFPLLHVDTTWKFREMIEFRDRRTRELNVDLVVHTNHVDRSGQLIMVDDERLPLRLGERPRVEVVRFRTLGCYPLSAAVRSTASDADAIVQEMLTVRTQTARSRPSSMREG